MSGRREELPFAAVHAALRERFELEHGDPGRDLVADLSGRTAIEVAHALRALVAPRTEEVVVLWPGDGRAVRMPVGDLIDDLAELWHAGSDDLLAADPSRRWVVLLDHGARLWFLDG
jgi:hypothetical protein